MGHARNNHRNNNNLYNAVDLVLVGNGGLSLIDRITRLEALSSNTTTITTNNNTNNNDGIGGNENGTNGNNNTTNNNGAAATLRHDVRTGIALAIFVVVGRDTYPVQVICTTLTTIFVVLFSSGTLVLMVSIWALLATFDDVRRRRRQLLRPGRQDGDGDGDLAPGQLHQRLSAAAIRRIEQIQLADAVRRSRVER